MAGDWSKVRIEDIAEKIAMGPFGSNIKVETFVDDGIPVISGAHLHGFRVEDGNFNFITEDHAERLKNSNVFRGDVIFTHAGNIGQVAYVPQDSQYERYVISQRQFYLRCKPDIADPAFITYFFHSAEGQHKLLANASQTGVPSIAQPSSYLKTIELLLPPLAEQRAIAHILGTLDDKIELNRKQNETLEAMARALFKAWFVDFEPVRAKMEGRWQRGQSLPGLPAHLYDLFPDRLVESELGEIPEGWEVAKVDAVLERLPAKVRYTKEQVSRYGKVPVFEQGASILLGFHDGDAAFQATPESPAFVFGDHTCITKLSCQPFDISQNVIPLRGKNRPTIWVYHAVRDKQKFEEYRRHWMELINKSIVVAPQSICLEFSRLVTFFHLQLEECERESLSISQLRDFLLPKLISGELRIADAEDFLKGRGS